MSQQQPPILPSREPDAGELALVKLWIDLEKGQLDILDQSNKRIIELVTGLQGLFLAIAAFGKDFPPAYLQQGLAPYLAVAAITLFILALLAAILGLQPRDYRKFEHNLSGMRAELDKIIHYKKRWYQTGVWLFAAGIVLLALLLVLLILPKTA
jgi:hypothetical protein